MLIFHPRSIQTEVGLYAGAYAISGDGIQGQVGRLDDSSLLGVFLNSIWKYEGKDDDSDDGPGKNEDSDTGSPPPGIPPR